MSGGGGKEEEEAGQLQMAVLACPAAGWQRGRGCAIQMMLCTAASPVGAEQL